MRAKRSPLDSLDSLREELAKKALADAKAAKPGAKTRGVLDLERQLFIEHVKDVRPLVASGRVAPPASDVKPVARQRALDEARALAESLSDAVDGDALLETDDLLSWRRTGISADIVRKLRRGEWVVQAELDLHGLRRDEARLEVSEFLRASIKRGLRCVRVIHGKGLGSAGGQPVLKAKVRGWLAQRDEVLAFCQARAKDGGSGALMVLLRPARKP
jgi:DNA-nicking Smr family endonuclease